jgi:mono/diheme cytochrome c family protein
MKRIFAPLVVFLGAVAHPSPAAPQEPSSLPDGKGKELVAEVCSQCHGLRPLFFHRADARKWEMVVHEMIAFGAQVTPEERDDILEYVKTTFAAGPALSTRTAPQLPPGDGREILQSTCASCHGTALIARTRADRAEWEKILHRHTAGERVALPAAQLGVLLEYLVANFSGAAAPSRQH